MIDTVRSLSAMLRQIFGERLDPSAETFVEMFAEDGIMEFPYALPHALHIRGREALATHLESNARRIMFLDVADVVEHETTDPELFIIEFAGFGRNAATGAPFEQHYVSVIRVRFGRIVHYVDYWNPIEILRTLKGSRICRVTRKSITVMFN